MFEQAKWMTAYPITRWGFTGRAEEFPPSPYLTRRFSVNRKVQSAVLHIVGLGQAAYYVNGVRIPDSCLPTQPSNPTVTVLFESYDITGMLRQGENCIGAVLGNNGYFDLEGARWRAPVKLIADLCVQYEDGEEHIVSDSAWKTAPSPTLLSMRRCGDKYDARLEIPGWCAPGFDDSAWKQASVCPGPGGVLRKSHCPPVRVQKELPGKEIGKGIFDFGELTCGWVRIRVKGKRGEPITVKYAEALTSQRDHVDQRSLLAPCKSLAHKDIYIPKSEGWEEWEQLFSYHGFRYVEIDGEYAEIAVTAVVAYSDLLTTAGFSTDHQILNGIYNACVQSILTCCHGAPVDCPQREQNEWTGDGMLSAEPIAMAFDSYGMFYEWMLKFQDDQRPNGSLPCIVPARDCIWNYNFALGPDWDSALIHIPYYCFRYSGNPAIVNLVWENMNRLLDYFSTLSENRVLPIEGVGDWCPVSETCDRVITNTVYYYLDAVMMAEMAQATGRDAEPYRKLAEEIRRDFRAAFVRDGKMTDRHVTALAAAIGSGMLTDEEAEQEACALAEQIRLDGNCFTGGVHGLRMLFDALSDHGQMQTVFDYLTNTECRGYGRYVAHGLNTLPESFEEEVEGSSSLNHHFRSPVMAWFFRHLAGIRFCGFGTGNLVIQPGFVKGLDRVCAVLQGVRVEYDAQQLSVDSPYPFLLIYNGKKTSYPAGSYRIER